MMDLEPKGELPTPRSSFSIFDPKIHLALYGSSLYFIKNGGPALIKRYRLIRDGSSEIGGRCISTGPSPLDLGIGAMA